MRDHIFVASMWEDEILKASSGDGFDLEKEAINAYYERSAKRSPKSDSLIGEVLLDLIINVLLQDCAKLKIRWVAHYKDRHEVKGFDLSYISVEDGKLTLWLGQAKAGGKYYCKREIEKDLVKSSGLEYMANEMLALIDCNRFRIGAEYAEDLSFLTDAVHAFNIHSTDKVGDFYHFIVDNKIQIMFPCLVAYGNNTCYNDIKKVCENLKKETEYFMKTFSGKDYPIEDIDTKVFFFLFPLKSLDKLRSKDGVYDKLEA